MSSCSGWINPSEDADRGSVEFDCAELCLMYSTVEHSLTAMRFGGVEPPKTHSNLPCRPASPFVIVV